MNTTTSERTSNGTVLMPLDCKLIDCREISVEEEISRETANTIRKLINLMNKSDSEQPIKLFINSPGGDVNQALAIFDIIQGSPAPVVLYCVGEAFSAAAIILAAGKHGRYITPNSNVMLHQPLISGGVIGNCTAIQATSERLMQTKARINTILAHATGHTVQEIDEASAYDHFFSPEEAVDFNLVDRIMSFSEMITEVNHE